MSTQLMDIELLRWLEQYKVDGVLPDNRNPLYVYDEPVEIVGRNGKPVERVLFYTPATCLFYRMRRSTFRDLSTHINFPGESAWALATADQKKWAIGSLLRDLELMNYNLEFYIAVPEWSHFLMPMLRVKRAEDTIKRMFPGENCKEMLNPAWVMNQGQLDRYDLKTMTDGFTANGRIDLATIWMAKMI